MVQELPVFQVPTIQIAGSDIPFQVRRIYCVGQNYTAHAREMGSDPNRQPPFFFSKPPDSVVASGRRLPYPRMTSDLHYEVELVIALRGGGADIAPSAVPDLIFGHGVGIDLTRRDLQAEAKKAGRPWDMSKGFDRSAPIGPLRKGRPPDSAAISLLVDGEVRQSGDLKDMIWSVSDIVSCLSSFVEIAAGDVIFTGTPAGVGPIRRGEEVRGRIAGVDDIVVTFE